MKMVLFILALIPLAWWAFNARYESNVPRWLESSKIIYKLEGDKWTQVTSLDQIKDGIYVIIR